MSVVGRVAIGQPVIRLRGLAERVFPVYRPHVMDIQAEVDTESIGTVLCRKAESLDAAAIIVSCEARSKLQEFFLGSITNFCTCAPFLTLLQHDTSTSVP